MSNSLKWSLVLFDLDGTLADTVPLIVASHQYAFREIKKMEISDELAKSWIGRTLPDVFSEQDPDLAQELFDAYQVFNKANTDSWIKGFPGVPQMLERLHNAGAKTGVVTSKMANPAKRGMQLAGIPEETVLAVALEDTKIHKPNPEPLLLAMKKLGAKPEETVYIGDAVWDLAAAHAAGASGIGVTWGAGKADELRASPNIGVVDTPEQLIELLIG